MRVWLAASFAGVAFVTAAAVYVAVGGSSAETLRSQSEELAIGRAVRLAGELSGAADTEIPSIVARARTDSFAPIFVDTDGNLVGLDGTAPAPAWASEPSTQALDGGTYSRSDGERSVVAATVYGDLGVSGAVVARAEPPPVLSRAFDDLRADRLRALAIAILIGGLVGLAVATLISTRLRRLAKAAERLASGRFAAPLPTGGYDEIGDLARSLDSMREALRGSFEALATERDRLGAILDGLNDAVVVVGEEGAVRFSNPAARGLVREAQPAAALVPVLRAAAEDGVDRDPALEIEERVWSVHARAIPTEHAVLVVARDRTDEIRREQAERDFVSNAAHELRNPLAGISGTIEVLRGGAKDDPEARERFLERLGEDVERMTRLTQALLALAAAEAGRDSEARRVVDVSVAAQEAAGSVSMPEGIELREEIGPELVAQGDPMLLRQVLIGLLTNARKHTPAPGVVTMRALREPSGEITVEVSDTGTGIPPEEQERVFERFYRGSGSRRSEGFGLGLSIASRMVDLMGGEIGLRSLPGRGSTFWVKLRPDRSVRTPTA